MDGTNRKTGIYVWIGAGLVFLLGGLWLLISAFQLAGRSEADNAALEALCLQRLQNLGTAARVGDRLRLVVPKVPSPRAGVEDASAITAACPGWALAYFCMGSACEGGPEVKMIVEITPAR